MSDADQSLDADAMGPPAQAIDDEESKEPIQGLDDNDSDSGSESDTDSEYDSDYDADDHAEKVGKKLAKLGIPNLHEDIKIIVRTTVGDETKDLEFIINKKCAMPAGFIRGFFEQYHEKKKIILTNITHPDLFHHIIEYLEHHNGIEQPIIKPPLKSKNMVDICKPPLFDPWDAEFIDGLAKDMQVIYKLTEDANYLMAVPLLHLLCVKIATEVTPMSQEEIQAGIEKQKREREAAEKAAAEKAAEQPPVVAENEDEGEAAEDVLEPEDEDMID